MLLMEVRNNKLKKQHPEHPRRSTHHMATNQNNRRTSSSTTSRASSSTRRSSAARARSTSARNNQTQVQRRATGKKSAASRQGNTARANAKSTQASAKTTARNAARTATSSANAAETRFESLALTAERGVLVGTGAALIARDNVVNTVKPYLRRETAQREIQKLQRKTKGDVRNGNLTKVPNRIQTAATAVAQDVQKQVTSLV